MDCERMKVAGEKREISLDAHKLVSKLAV